MTRLYWEGEHSIYIVDHAISPDSPYTGFELFGRNPDALVSLFKRIGPSLRVLAFYVDDLRWHGELAVWKEQFYEALLRVPEFCANLEAIAIRGPGEIPEWMRFDTFSALKKVEIRENQGGTLGKF